MQKQRIYVFILFFISCGLSHRCFSQEVPDTHLESQYLKNIQQLTFPNMGFEKAGEAYFSSNEESIIFQAVPIGNTHYQIYAMPLEINTPSLVSTGKGACTCAFFKPDGSKIIFASSHEAPADSEDSKNASLENSNYAKGKYHWDLTPYMNIYEANPDGSGLVPLTQGPAYHAECAYSSDGSSIVYASNETGSMNIYTMKADGSEIKQITNTDYCYNGGPFFSPDNSKIIFRADRERPDFLQIYVINADGTGEQQLTFNNAVNWAPYWHPNGKVIAFTTSLHGHYQYEIYLLNIQTGAFTRLTHNPTFDGLPVFNHDGTKLLWTSKRGADKTCQIFIADFIMPPELN
jgi:TolB protein